MVIVNFLCVVPHFNIGLIYRLRSFGIIGIDLLDTAKVKGKVSLTERAKLLDYNTSSWLWIYAFWRENNTLAPLRHCQDSSEVKSRHLTLAMSLLSPAPTGPGFQTT